ncbi:LacI family DNA-binding transcriptional regulator [Bifidobacterium sp. SMB2]|uniref:LacI family DNA-binding transcriptional regulator n=1 Tax=Bifidobacterium saimiriisciurei TaxID=2661627 RepID=A0ABX0CAL5_9BIFI|nr:LacI family DNA-binding transcriptional regulator [Bifidobacterium sp. SMB2]NEH12157.1 LacI family DNA-binding transcriptional regulator [Bifidobacterium saimiriisciurei]
MKENGVASLKDVAAAAGVSESTVSRALRGTGRVSEKTRARVQEVADRLHFTLSRSASSLASGKTMRVTMVFTDSLNTWFNSAAMQGAYEVLADAGYDLVPLIVRTQADLRRFFEQLPGNRNADGMIVVSIMLDQQQVGILEDLTIPSVGLDARAIGGYSATVRVDDMNAMRQAVQLLNSLGHKRIGFVEMPDNPDFQFSAKLRSGAFLDVARSMGYGEDELSLFEGRDFGKFHSFQDAVSEAANRIISKRDRPTAVCVETDDFAIALMYAVRKVGLRVPEDLAVIGFDDNALSSMAELTTLHQDPQLMGRMAAEKLVTLMRGETLSDPHSMLQASLILRSTATRM